MSPKSIKKNNYAFIDSQNVAKGIKVFGWELDWRRFRVYLSEKYNVTTAYLFIGYIPKYQERYSELQKAGFVLVFKPVLPNGNNGVKGNVDADLVLQAMIDLTAYDRAVIVSSDGDFYSLVRYLYENEKLEVVLSPHVKNCSILLKQSAKEHIWYMNNLKEKIGKKKTHRLRTEP
jgi:uncharacterized LabA/DUF88 family protein